MTNTAKLVLLAHHDTEELSRCREDLENDGFRVQGTSSGNDVLRRMDSQIADAIILEALLPRQNGLSVLKNLKLNARFQDVPVLLVLDDGDTYTENRARICGVDGIVRRSADGTLPEGALTTKLRRVLTESSMSKLISEESPEGDGIEKILESAAENLVADNPVRAHITDSITGLSNADYMAIRLEDEFKRTRRSAKPLTMIMLGLRRGDEAVENEVDADWRRILNEVAGLLLCECRDIDILAREDASTFCLLLPHTPASGARTMTDRVLSSIASRGIADESGEPVQASAGLVEFTGENFESAEEISSRALVSLRLSTRSGGGAVVTWTPSDA